jgi:ankyrin repeat protein
MLLVRTSLALLLAAAAISAQPKPSSDELFAALKAGVPGQVERLLERGADANAADADGTPALMAAALFGDARLVELLLSHGADPNRADRSGSTALMWAVPDLDKVRVLLAKGANVNAKSETERTALLVAASYPRTVELLKALLAKGADLRAQDRAGATALSLAVRSSDVGVVRFLVDSGLDLNAMRPAAVRVGLARWDTPTADFLMSKGLSPGNDVLVATANWQPTTAVSRWLAAGADVNAKNTAQYGRTPLLTAVTSERAGVDTLTLLLDKGADPNVPTTEGDTPLDWAVYKGDRAKIQALESHGAKAGTSPRRDAIAPPARGGITDAKLSLTNSVARLLETAPKFKTQTSCISCHHNTLPAMAAAAAQKKGVAVDEANARRNLDDLYTFFVANAPRMMLGDPAVGGEALTAGYASYALAAAGHAPDRITATITHWLMARQMPDGSWLGNGLNRPPMEYSLVSHTAMAAAGLRAYPIPGRAKEIAEVQRRAQAYLLAASTTSAEERAMRLMGLAWTQAPKGRIDAAIRDVRQQQDASGGWSQFSRTDPDAYATGLSLYALHVAGVKATDEAYKKGVAYLLANQYQDGTWLIRTHSFPVQRYFESGFPYGRHQWISTAGTSWAALAVAETLPDAPVRR